jgi:hypothetical protein
VRISIAIESDMVPRDGARNGESRMRKWAVAALLLASAGCGQEAAKPVAAEAPTSFPAGEYEIASEVTRLASVDKSVPATRLKLGDKAVTRACVAGDGTPDPAMFVEAGDQCTVDNTYGRSGRVSVQYSCQRTGKGPIYVNADGNYKADSFEVLVTAASKFSGSGDYELARHLTAKRVGACPAGAAKG